MFIDADGASQCEALRCWRMTGVLPVAGLIEHELSERFETDASLAFDNYSLDLVGRAQAFQKLVAGGVSVNDALVKSGLMADKTPS